MARATAWTPCGREARSNDRSRDLQRVWEAALPGVPPEDWAQAGIFRRVHECSRREEIFRQGEPNDGLYCVACGIVGLGMADSRGETVTIRVATPGDIVGYRSLVSGEAHAVSGIALTPAVVSHIPPVAVRHLLDRHPEAERALVRRVARDAHRSYQAFMRVATMSVRHRFLHFLMVDMEPFARTDGAGTRRVPLTLQRSDIASLLGTVPETMSRTLRRLAHEGLVEIDGDTAVIPDPGRAMAALPDPAGPPSTFPN